MKRLAVIIGASLLLAACASTAKKDNAQLAQKAEAGTQVPTQVQVATSQLKELQSNEVYFDFDKAIIKHEFQNAVKQEANFLKDHPKDKVTLVGNTDERGSDEYNLALGGKRAHAVRKELEVMGVKAKQIHTVSYGKEHPRLTCHEEKCWKENRRVDFEIKQS